MKFISAIILIASIAIPFNAKAEDVKYTFTTDEWCPYSCDPESSNPGISIEIIKEIFGNKNTSFRAVNWARAIKEVRSGEGHAIVDAYISDAPDFIFHKTPIIQSKMCMFVKSTDSWQYTNHESLKNRKILVINGYSYGEQFDKYIIENNKQGNSNIRVLAGITGEELTKRKLKMIKRERADSILEDHLVFLKEIKDYEEKNNVKTSFKNAGCFDPVDLFIAFTPANKTVSEKLAQKMDEGIEAMKKSGKLDSIISKYTK